MYLQTRKTLGKRSVNRKTRYEAAWYEAMHYGFCHEVPPSTNLLLDYDRPITELQNVLSSIKKQSLSIEEIDLDSLFSEYYDPKYNILYSTYFGKTHSRLRSVDFLDDSRLSGLDESRKINFMCLKYLSPFAFDFLMNYGMMRKIHPDDFVKIAKELGTTAKMWGDTFTMVTGVKYQHIVDCVYLGGFWDEKIHDFDQISDASWLWAEPAPRPEGYVEFYQDFLRTTISGIEMKKNSEGHPSFYPTIQSMWEDPITVGTTGSDPSYKLRDIDGKRIRSTKNLSLGHMPFSDFRRRLLEPYKQRNSLVLKNEPGKIRNAVQVDARVYLSIFYLYGPLIYGTLPFPSAYNEAVPDKVKRYTETSRYCQSCISFPADFDNFQGTQRKDEIMMFEAFLWDYTQSIGVIQEDREKVRHILVSAMEDGYFDLPDGTTKPWSNGMPSGILWTSMLNSIQNRCYHLFMNKLARKWGARPITHMINQGDDAQIFYDRYSDALLHYTLGNEWWGMNPKKFFFSGPQRGRTEFLRQVITAKGEVYGYGCRQIISITSAKPWSTPPLDESEVYGTIISNLNELCRRFETTEPKEIALAIKTNMIRRGYGFLINASHNWKVGLTVSPKIIRKQDPVTPSRLSRYLEDPYFSAISVMTPEHKWPSVLVKKWRSRFEDSVMLKSKTDIMARAIRKHIKQKTFTQVDYSTGYLAYTPGPTTLNGTIAPKTNFFGNALHIGNESSLLKDWLVRTPVNKWSDAPVQCPNFGGLVLLARTKGKGFALKVFFDEIRIPTVLGTTCSSAGLGFLKTSILSYLESRIFRKSLSIERIEMTVLQALLEWSSEILVNWHF